MKTMTDFTSDILTRDYTVDLSVTGMDAIHATGKNFHGDRKVVNAMPRAERESGKLYFFKIGRYIKASELKDEAIKRGLVLADPHTLAGYNKAQPDFAKEFPNGTQWIDADGKVCLVTFGYCLGERVVVVDCDFGNWSNYWWFACFRIDLSPST